MPKLYKVTFEQPLLNDNMRRENSVEMYMAGVSVRRVKDITEALWEEKVSPGTISELNQKVYVRIDE